MLGFVPQPNLQCCRCRCRCRNRGYRNARNSLATNLQRFSDYDYDYDYDNDNDCV
ncbi:hypothetical protein [uncultured Thiodictyon sp.]|uniref:hypothetical protein n=1 Tax=uncultured Thiodictyon sp. TaxID=1846217 RepID=UPI0025DE2900|nr:hypothetical protein [uncultured Thiodictyon sp.]